jgi:hypothetical protein
MKKLMVISTFLSLLIFLAAAKPAVPTVSAVGVYLPEGRHPIIPFFQHSIIPINCERSEPESYNMPGTKNGELDKKKHYDYSWKVHKIAKDFKLLDVWEFPILADKSKGQDLALFLKIVQDKQKYDLKNGISPRLLMAGFLVVLRNFMAKIFPIDKDVNTLPIPGCKETSLRERLSREDQEKNLAEQEIKGNEKKRGFRVVYLYENESLWELSNNTVHALMHLGWVCKYDNYFTARLAVYAKTRGWLGYLYMKLIMPFRRHIIYPVTMNYVKAKWEAYCKKEKK